MATDSRKKLALAILDFLNSSLKDGALAPEDRDSIEVASNCISEAFHVDPTDTAAMQDAIGGQNLLQIYSVYEKMKGKTGAASSTPAAASKDTASKSASAPSAQSSVPQPGQTGGPTPESEGLKSQGNAAMQKKDFKTAVEMYTKALEIAPLNPIYLSNRAAAYSADSDHELAKNDAELAVAADPKYTKAWSRLGLALFALGDAKGSMEAYQKGIEHEGNGGSDAMRKGFETAKRKVESEGAMDVDETSRSAEQPDLGGLGGLASMLGGGGGAGGMPDLGSLMQNPMMRQMAQNLMSNPDMMSNIMNNPALRNLAGRYGGAGGGEGGEGGTPNISELMNDPAIADMARNFMGSMGGAGRGA